MLRFEIKQQAKDALRDNFGAKMLLFIIPIIWTILDTANNTRITFENWSKPPTETILDTWLILTGFVTSIASSLAISLLLSIITTGAVFNYIKIFRGERERPRFTNCFTPFTDGSLWKIVTLNLVQYLIIFVLILIPIVGWIFLVYFALGWSQSTYVLYDQIEEGRYVGTMGVLRESSQIMRGWRADYFVFQLSFIGWWILSGITGGLVGFYTVPYINMSMVSYYENLLDEIERRY